MTIFLNTERTGIGLVVQCQIRGVHDDPSTDSDIQPCLARMHEICITAYFISPVLPKPVIQSDLISFSGFLLQGFFF